MEGKALCVDMEWTLEDVGGVAGDEGGGNAKTINCSNT